MISFDGNTMGGTWSVKISQLPASVSPETLRTSVGTLLNHLDGEMSIWKPDSALSRFNQYRRDDWFAAPADLAEVVSVAQQVSEQTGGAFDVTVGPLVLLWGFGPEKSGGQFGQIPSDAQISAAKSHVNYQLLECRLSPPALRERDPLTYVDLGGVAKGYAADAVGRHLDSMGIQNYLIAVGGELRGKCLSSSGRAWRAGIETPTPDVRRIIEQLPRRDQSLSTSGDYRNFFEVEGTRFCHVIDPHTGRPINNSAASVSVIHQSGAYADAMATGLMVLGPEHGYALAVRLKLPALFVTRGEDRLQLRKTPGNCLACPEKRPAERNTLVEPANLVAG